MIFVVLLRRVVCFKNVCKWGNVVTTSEVFSNVMLSVSRLAARSASTSLLFRSYGKVRELAATVPGKKPVVCSPEEVVECVKSNDKVIY